MVVFWGTTAVLGFTFLGYPLFIGLLASRKPRVAPPPSPLEWPTVECLLVVHNEAPRIAARVENLLNSHYPTEQLRLIVVCDGCTDDTARLARQAGGARVRVIEQSPRQGKAAGLNAGMAAAQAEVVVLADARQEFAPDAIAWLVRYLGQPGVGAVSGNYALSGTADNVGGGVDAYWRLEKFIRQAESRWDSVIGCTGAIYALRRELFEPVPPDTLLDDVVIPMQMVLRGWRVVFAAEARAWEGMKVAAEREFLRKRRTLAGNFQMLFRYPQWLMPWRNRLWWALFCHKYLRLLAPAGLVLLMGANIWLARASTFYAIVLAGQVVFYALALAGMLFSGWRGRLFTLPAGFVFLNAATVAGLWYYLRHGHRGGWETVSPPTPDVQST